MEIALPGMIPHYYTEGPLLRLRDHLIGYFGNLCGITPDTHSTLFGRLKMAYLSPSLPLYRVVVAHFSKTSEY